MGNLTIWHWLIVLLVVVLLIFDTKKLRNIGSDLGGVVKGFKEGMREDEPKHDMPTIPISPIVAPCGNESSGVGGWLAFLIAGMMFLGPFLNIAIIKGKLLTLEEHYPRLAASIEWNDYKTAEWIAIFIFWAISFFGGLGLMTKRTPDAVTRAKLVLWFNYPICIIVTGVIIPTVMIRDSGRGIEDVLGYNIGAAIPGFIASLIGLWIWTAYLNKSKRVCNTYGLGATGKHDVDQAMVGGSQQAAQSAPFVSKPTETARSLPEESKGPGSH